jgi:hypothetical protein
MAMHMMEPDAGGEDAMSSTSLVRSGYSRDWGAEPAAERRRSRPPSRESGGGGFMRFVITFCIGVGATLAWQSYGDTARQMIAGSYPQLGWLAPRAVAAQVTSPAAAPARSPESQELRDLAADLATTRQRIDQLFSQLAASQEHQDQLTRDIAARLQAAERSILDKIAAIQTKPDVPAARRPPPQPQSPSQTLTQPR